MIPPQFAIGAAIEMADQNTPIKSIVTRPLLPRRNRMLLSQAISVVARLGIADLASDGGLHYSELARLTKTHGPSLHSQGLRP
jgi:hypothetical protein